MDGSLDAGSRLTREALEQQRPGWRLTTYPDPVAGVVAPAPGLPPVASRVLRELGLPQHVPVLFTGASPSRHEGAPAPDGAVVVGRVWNDALALLVGPDETVLARHEDGELTYVNRDLECWLRFLVRADVLREQMDAVDDGLVTGRDHESLVAAEREAMRRTDPRALADGSWWPGVVDELLMV